MAFRVLGFLFRVPVRIPSSVLQFHGIYEGAAGLQVCHPRLEDFIRGLRGGGGGGELSRLTIDRALEFKAGLWVHAGL